MFRFCQERGFVNHLFLCFWLCWVFTAAWAFSGRGERGYSLVAVSGLLGVVSSLVAEHGLWGARASAAAEFNGCGSRAAGHRLSSCGSWAPLLQAMWNLPRSGMEPVSPALAGRFLPTSHQGSPWKGPFKISGP